MESRMINPELIAAALTAFETQTVALMNMFNYDEAKYPEYLKDAINILKQLNGE